jgi:hypothetical protein
VKFVLKRKKPLSVFLGMCSTEHGLDWLRLDAGKEPFGIIKSTGFLDYLRHW